MSTSATRPPIPLWLQIFALCCLSALLGAVATWQLFGSPPRPLAASRELPRVRPDIISSPARGFDWSRLPEPDFAIPPYAEHLRGVRIVLDPGHVGQTEQRSDPNFKRGPTGLREAAVNLRVALFLREFLNEVGAEVILTRDRDIGRDITDSDDLVERAEIANRARADLMLSIHHNAAANASANHTLVFYHSDPDHSPASLSAARYILQGINDALRLATHVPCPVASDMVIHPKAGMGLLRRAQVPAVLSEASFYTHPPEEERLRDPTYNRREAHGLFLGLARWAQAGLPRITLREPAQLPAALDAPIVISLDDGLTGRRGFGEQTPKILESSIRVRINGQPVGFSSRDARRTVVIPADALPPSGPVRLFVDFENVFGQHVIHPWIDLRTSHGNVETDEH